MSTNTEIILIAGGTASGKTTITTEFAKKYNILVIQHDRYYKDITQPEGHNFDEPDALDNDLLTKHLQLLKQGLPVELPVYHFPSHRRLPETETIRPQRFIIVEGILTLAVPEIRNVGDVLIYVDAPDDIRLARRLQRDVVSRGRSVQSVLTQYLNTVRPMHLHHVEPSQQYASLILDGTQPTSYNIAKIAKEIKIK